MGTKIKEYCNIQALGDQAIVLYFEQKITQTIHEQVLQVANLLKKHPLPNQQTLIPSYASITLRFTEPFHAAGFAQIKNALLTLELEDSVASQDKAPMVIIPVCYGGKLGPDLLDVAKLHDLTEAEVIRLHTEPIYEVYQIGFTPGFPYLGGLPKELHTPRLPTPRRKVVAGSVGIGAAQTGVYTLDGPGGWRIIGWTSLKLFDPERDPPTLLRPGMKVKFVRTEE